MGRGTRPTTDVTDASASRKASAPGQSAGANEARGLTPAGSPTKKTHSHDRPADAAVPPISPFDALDPAAIPAGERFEWQPKELVAVLGSHRQRLWSQGTQVALSGDGATAVAMAESNGILLDVAAGTTTRLPEAALGHVVALSPDGRMQFRE